jgi:hypothetical protein
MHGAIDTNRIVSLMITTKQLTPNQTLNTTVAICSQAPLLKSHTLSCVKAQRSRTLSFVQSSHTLGRPVTIGLAWSKPSTNKRLIQQAQHVQHKRNTIAADVVTLVVDDAPLVSQ